MKYDAKKELLFLSKFLNFLFVAGIFFNFLVAIYLIHKFYNPTYLLKFETKQMMHF